MCNSKDPFQWPARLVFETMSCFVHTSINIQILREFIDAVDWLTKKRFFFLSLFNRSCCAQRPFLIVVLPPFFLYKYPESRSIHISPFSCPKNKQPCMKEKKINKKKPSLNILFPWPSIISSSLIDGPRPGMPSQKPKQWAARLQRYRGPNL